MLSQNQKFNDYENNAMQDYTKKFTCALILIKKLKLARDYRIKFLFVTNL
uniref:Uncharacterized protein n=1 Tax=Rhizophagus irregularis (strain DAOM 181602 / DAOM 197198 / MUCL 43194) TaxID=747089 RepID=U9UJ62_RHIID